MFSYLKDLHSKYWHFICDLSQLPPPPPNKKHAFHFKMIVFGRTLNEGNDQVWQSFDEDDNLHTADNDISLDKIESIILIRRLIILILKTR